MNNVARFQPTLTSVLPRGQFVAGGWHSGITDFIKSQFPGDLPSQLLMQGVGIGQCGLIIADIPCKLSGSQGQVQKAWCDPLEEEE